MPLDRAGTDEHPRTDLGVGQSLGGEARDLQLLRGQIVTGLDDPTADSLAGRLELPARAFGERLYAD